MVAHPITKYCKLLDKTLLWLWWNVILVKFSHAMNQTIQRTVCFWELLTSESKYGNNSTHERSYLVQKMYQRLFIKVCMHCPKDTWIKYWWLRRVTQYNIWIMRPNDKSCSQLFNYPDTIHLKKCSTLSQTVLDFFGTRCY